MSICIEELVYRPNPIFYQYLGQLKKDFHINKFFEQQTSERRFFMKLLLYPTQRVAESIMFLTRPSVLFFLLAQLLWNRSTEFRETL